MSRKKFFYIFSTILLASLLLTRTPVLRAEDAEEETPVEETSPEDQSTEQKPPATENPSSSDSQETQKDQEKTPVESPQQTPQATPAEAQTPSETPAQTTPAAQPEKPVISVPSNGPEKTAIPAFAVTTRATPAGPSCINYAEPLTALYSQKISEIEKFLEKSRLRLKSLLEYEQSVQKDIDDLNGVISQINMSDRPIKEKNKEIAKKQKQMKRLNKQLADAKTSTQAACKEIGVELGEIGGEHIQEIKQAFKESQNKIQYGDKPAKKFGSSDDE